MPFFKAFQQFAQVEETIFLLQGTGNSIIGQKHAAAMQGSGLLAGKGYGVRDKADDVVEQGQIDFLLINREFTKFHVWITPLSENEKDRQTEKSLSVLLKMCRIGMRRKANGSNQRNWNDEVVLIKRSQLVSHAEDRTGAALER